MGRRHAGISWGAATLELLDRSAHRSHLSAIRVPRRLACGVASDLGHLLAFGGALQKFVRRIHRSHGRSFRCLLPLGITIATRDQDKQLRRLPFDWVRSRVVRKALRYIKRKEQGSKYSIMDVTLIATRDRHPLPPFCPRPYSHPRLLSYPRQMAVEQIPFV